MSDASAPEGVLIVDKPEGPTSHDVVGRVRRVLRMKRVGHAGTLDPMASGVLVILVGEATKLGPYLTMHRKRYEARVAFGVATDTLDRLGTEVASAEVPGWLREELAGLPGGHAPRIDAALAAERARTAQEPPVFSAIKVDGKRSYARARAGEAVELPPRSVEVLALAALRADAAGAQPSLDLALEVSKGYYVRSLARDLGLAVGLPAHLTALRRTTSGPFTLATALDLRVGENMKARDALLAALIPIAAAAQIALPTGQLNDAGVIRARHGKLLADDDFTTLPPLDEPSAWLDARGRLIAVGTRRPASFVLHRGFVEDRATGVDAEHDDPDNRVPLRPANDS